MLDVSCILDSMVFYQGSAEELCIAVCLGAFDHWRIGGCHQVGWDLLLHLCVALCAGHLTGRPCLAVLTTLSI